MPVATGIQWVEARAAAATPYNVWDGPCLPKSTWPQISLVWRLKHTGIDDPKEISNFTIL